MLKRELTQTLAKTGTSLVNCLCSALWFGAWLKLKKPYKHFCMDGINKIIFEEAIKSSLLNNLNKHHWWIFCLVCTLNHKFPVGVVLENLGWMNDKRMSPETVPYFRPIIDEIQFPIQIDRN